VVIYGGRKEFASLYYFFTTFSNMKKTTRELMTIKGGNLFLKLDILQHWIEHMVVLVEGKVHYIVNEMSRCSICETEEQPL
jgi:hypothetical protein